MIKPLAAVFFLVGVYFASAQYSSAEVAEDLVYLQEQLASYHPGLYRYSSQEQLENAFNESKAKGSMSNRELYAEVTRIISQIGCGHTRTRMSPELENKIESTALFLPFSVKFLGEHVFIDKSSSSQLKSGDQVISINGLPINEIKDEVYMHLSADGFIQTGKAKRLELLFAQYFQLFLAPDSNEFDIEIMRNEEVSIVKVDGISSAELNTLRTYDDTDLMSLSMMEDYAILRIGSFGSQTLHNGGYDYETFLAESFKQLRDKKVRNLILDLRGNGGGSDNYGATLVSYLARDSYGYFDNIQVTKSYPGISKKAGDKYFMTNHRGLSVWAPAENNFTGNVYVLIDGFSFSTCADVATVLHHHQWATFIGEETGGGYDGNTSGHSKSITLPNSGIRMNLPMWMYTTANVGHAFFGRGVIPDYQIVSTWDEYASGRDLALEKAIELIVTNKGDR